MCLECGGRRRRWRPDVRALRVAISALADDDTCRSIGEESGHAGGSVAGRVLAGRTGAGAESAWARRRQVRRDHGT
eukprot:4640210-Pleurochrysis_carterae.AAC.1